MRRRMRSAIILCAAVSIGLSGTAMAGPTSPEETVLNSSDVALAETRSFAQQPAPTAVPTAIEPSPEPPTPAALGQTIDASIDVSIARLVAKTDPSQSYDGSNQQGMWHPGLEDRDLAPVLMTGTSSDATEESPVIPLPNSAWTGLAMLALLAIARFFRNFRRLLTI